MSATGPGPRADERVDTQAFKDVLAHWASGVTIVTANDEGIVHGMTVSSFSSLSLEPPLVLVCAFRGSRTRELIGRSGRFAVNLLAEGQAGLATRFAGRRTTCDRTANATPSPFRPPREMTRGARYCKPVFAWPLHHAAARPPGRSSVRASRSRR